MTNPDSPISLSESTEIEDDDAGPACVMVFNASDPSGAGGLAADVTAIASVGAHALSVVTGAYARDTAEISIFLPDEEAGRTGPGHPENVPASFQWLRRQP